MIPPLFRMPPVFLCKALSGAFGGVGAVPPFGQLRQIGLVGQVGQGDVLARALFVEGRGL